MASVTTGLFPVTSVAISGQLALAASWEDSLVATVPIYGSPSQSLAVGLGPGLTAALNGTMGVCGELLATRIVLIDLSGPMPILLGGPVNTQLQTVTTLGINPSATSTLPPGPPVTHEPQIVVTPASLDFGAARVNAAAVRTVTLENSGTAPLSVVGLKTSISQYVASPSGTLAAIPPGNRVTVQVTFKPTAVQSYPATLTMMTNDPEHRSVTVPMSGTGLMNNAQFDSDNPNVPAVRGTGTDGATGVYGTSDRSIGVFGASESFGVEGLGGISSGLYGSSGVVGFSGGGVGVQGISESGTGGGFASGSGAQLRLVPSSTPLEQTPLMQTGQVGDLYLFSGLEEVGTSGTYDLTTILWLWIYPASGQLGSQAMWASVQLGDTVGG